MAYCNMSFYSEELGHDIDVSIILPESRKRKEVLHPDKKYPVIYCLHGYGDNHTAWIRKSTIEIIARKYEVIIVMPAGHNSFYANHDGFNYFNFITEELPIKMANFFPVSLKREDTFIMGNSMGGYGAFKCAMSKPEKYAAAVSFSGIIGFDLGPNEGLLQKESRRDNIYSAVGDSIEEFRKSDNYLLHLAKKLDSYEGNKPKLLHLCGTEDFISYPLGEKFMKYIGENTNLHVDYVTGSGGHDWTFWNSYIVKVFEYFGFK